MTPALKIDVFSDICCPWCLIGSARLDAALGLLPPALYVDVEFHPFLLDRDTPPSGINVRDMLRQKHGVTDPTPVWDRIEAEAAAFDVELRLARQPMAYNSIDAHSVIRASRPKGTQRALHRAIIEAYFLDARDISDRDVLDAIARAHGFVLGEVGALLEDQAIREQTVRAAEDALAAGIRSVPAMIADDRHMLPGGTARQCADALRQLFDAKYATAR